MLNLKKIILDKNKIKTNLKNRNFNVQTIDKLLDLANLRSQAMSNLQKKEYERNKISKQIGSLKKQNQDATSLLQQMPKIKKEIEKISKLEKNINDKISKIMLTIPNTTLDDVPIGKNEKANKILNVRIIGRGKVIGVKPHYEIGISKNILNFQNAVKMSKTRFWAYKNLGAQLVRALENFMLDMHIQKGYEEILPPLLVNAQAMTGTGQLPKFKEEVFKIDNNDLFLIPTAEVSLTNFYSNQILNLEDPILLTAYTPCFRAEAGAGGKDAKGLIRAHQFNKVELVKIVKEEVAQKEFNKMLEDAKSILEALELSYQEILLCTGDTGFASQKTIDLEAWIPSENKFREVSSVSLFGDFQSRRAMIRYKDKKGYNHYAYTINGSGLAIDRVVAAILEIYQNKDGSISIPKVLIPYMKREEI